MFTRFLPYFGNEPPEVLCASDRRLLFSLCRRPLVLHSCLIRSFIREVLGDGISVAQISTLLVLPISYS
jgi:hypothetical protein